MSSLEPSKLVFNSKELVFHFNLESDIECLDLEYIEGNPEQYLVPTRFRMTFDQFLSNQVTNKYSFDYTNSTILEIKASSFSNNEPIKLEITSWQDCLESLFRYIADPITIGRIFPKLSIKYLQYDYSNREIDKKYFDQSLYKNLVVYNGDPNEDYVTGDWITKHGDSYQYRLPEEKVILEMLSRDIHNNQLNTNDYKKSFSLEYIKLKLNDGITILEIYHEDII